MRKTLVTRMSHYFGGEHIPDSSCLQLKCKSTCGSFFRRRAVIRPPRSLSVQYGSTIQILVDKGADVNAKDQSDQRPLAYTMKMDDHQWADLLKKHGAHE